MNLLLVDDDRISIDILAEYIKPYLKEINEVVCAYDGDEAFDIIISAKPNIIVTDIKMPKINGIELIKKIRAIGNYHPMIIIISGYSDFEYAREALKLDVFDYIVKPIDQDELIQKVNACLINTKEEKKEDHEDIFDRVQKYISNHLNESIKLIEISDHFHYNAAYLGRLVKDKTGMYYNDYVLKLRMIKAQSLLINTQYLIHKISSEVGFKDPEHFSKKFKNLVGMTPTIYRKQHQKKN